MPGRDADEAVAPRIRVEEAGSDTSTVILQNARCDEPVPARHRPICAQHRERRRGSSLTQLRASLRLILGLVWDIRDAGELPPQRARRA